MRITLRASTSTFPIKNCSYKLDTMRDAYFQRTQVQMLSELAHKKIIASIESTCRITTFEPLFLITIWIESGQYFVNVFDTLWHLNKLGIAQKIRTMVQLMRLIQLDWVHYCGSKGGQCP